MTGTEIKFKNLKPGHAYRYCLDTESPLTVCYFVVSVIHDDLSCKCDVSVVIFNSQYVTPAFALWLNKEWDDLAFGVGWEVL